MKLRRNTLALFTTVGSLLATWVAACGGSPSTGGFTRGTGASAVASGGGGGPSGSGGALPSSGPFGSGLGDGGLSAGSGTSCSGLACQIHACSGGGSTTVSGTVYDPAGKNPLYGIVAYVPNTKPKAFTPGAACSSCGELYTGDPIASAVTDASGNFTITGAPDGADIPLVIQVGKWRRQFTLPSVAMCQDTAVPMKLTLPKNGSEGDLPDIAISTGNADTLECLLLRVGVDASEYVPGPGGGGHIHIFTGPGGPTTQPAAPAPEKSLWDSDADIAKYDIVMLSCEGKETENMNRQVLFDYAAAGGRVFASHFHYAWFNGGPFGAANLATWKKGGNDIGDLHATVVTTTWDNQPFVRGQALYDWLDGPSVNALVSVGGPAGGASAPKELPITTAKQNAMVAMTNTASQPWLLSDDQSQAPGWSQDFTFDTPLNTTPDKQCGRVAYSDMHVGAASGDYVTDVITTPDGCGTMDLAPQEKALEFILFDLSACVTPNNMPQPPPTETK